MKLLVDLDQTLIDTIEVQPYMNTQAGRSFAANKINQIETQLISQDLKEFIEINDSIIYTNAPRNYAKAVLEKHGFKDLKIYAAMNKPFKSNLEYLLEEENLKKDEVVIIGDSPVDVLAGHALQIPTIISTIATEFSEKKLKRSEPNAILNNFEDIEEYLDELKLGIESYQPRIRKDKLYFYTPGKCDKIPISNLVDYYPIGFGRHAASQAILNFKEAKQIPFEKIKQKIQRKYFYGDRLRNDGAYINLANMYLLRLSQEINDMKLRGSTLVIAAPNSLPHYCYKFDINHRMAKNLNRELGNQNYGMRVLERYHPVPSKHSTGSNSYIHQTVGIKRNANINYNNIVIFDDVATSGSTLFHLADILRSAGFDGEIKGLVLGKTV